MNDSWDLKWGKGDYHCYDNLVPKLKDNAPEWVVESYKHYIEQLKERYGNKDIKKMICMFSFIEFLIA